MRVLFFGNNWAGWKVAAWMRQRGENLVGVVLHPPERRTFGKEIIDSAGVAPESVFNAAQLNNPDVFAMIRECKPDIGISVFFGYILRPDYLRLFPKGCINIHPALLPFNRGAHPNVWSIVDRTPAGVTIHYLDEGIDTGDIIAQRPVSLEPTDTGETLYRKLEKVSVELFMEQWPTIATESANSHCQVRESGTFHRLRDLQSIDEINLDRPYIGRELIDILRARTFPPHPGAFFLDNGRKIYIRLQLLCENDLATGSLDATLDKN